MRRILHIIGTALFYAVLMVTASSGAKAQVANPANLNVLLCNGPVGSIAVRYADRWRCLAPGAAGQLFQSNGPAAVGGWFTPTGTGNVATDGNATSGQFPYFTNGTTLAYMSPGGPLLDKVLGQSGATAGYLKRTGAGAYSIAAIPSSDLPAFSGNDCSIAAGSGAVSCAGLLTQAHTWTATQTFNTAIATQFQSMGAGSAVQIGDRNNARSTIIFRSNDTTYFFDSVNGGVFSYSNTGAVSFSSLTLGGSPLGVASGGTGSASASGTALDNITGFSGTGIMSRTGAGAYSMQSLSAYIDAAASATQGSILYRNASGWVALPPGTSGQFLAANGGGANPSWASPAAPPAGNRVLINTITASNSTALTDTTSLTSTYSEYEIDFESDYPVTTGAFGQLQLYIGGTLQTTGYNVVQQFVTTNGGPSKVANTNSGNIPLDDTTDGVATTGAFSNATGLNSRIILSAPSVSKITNLSIVSDYWGNSNGDIHSTGHGVYATAGVVTGFQFKFSTGNVASGKIKVYGWN